MTVTSVHLLIMLVNMVSVGILKRTIFVCFQGPGWPVCPNWSSPGYDINYDRSNS